MGNIKRFFILIGMLVFIPVGGYLVGHFIAMDYESQWEEMITREGYDLSDILNKGFTLEKYCSDPELGANEGVCQTFNSLIILKKSSAASLLIGISLIFIIFITARLSSNNQAFLSFIFNVELKFVLFVLFALIILQGAIATYGIYILESYLVNRVHIFLIGGIAMGALVGSFSMIKAGLSITKKLQLSVVGKSIDNFTQPKLYEFVQSLASRVGAIPPKNIVLGVEPSFYVTSVDVYVYPENQNLTNETLYISLPLLRILSLSELSSVIGHELGHFKGNDTVFTKKFYPIYSGTLQALASLEFNIATGSKGQGLALQPALTTLSFFFHQFSIAERKIGRRRELEADKVGTSVSSPNNFATALIKVIIFSSFWDKMKQTMVDLLNQGKYFTNISKIFINIVSKEDKQELLGNITEVQLSHPTDTHPTISTRMKELNINIKELIKTSLNFEKFSSSMDLIDDIEEIEEDITKAEHQILVSLGYAELPEEDEKNNDLGVRISCDDGNCIGIIGSDGYCKACGKPSSKVPHEEVDGLSCGDCQRFFAEDEIDSTNMFCPECGGRLEMSTR